MKNVKEIEVEIKGKDWDKFIDQAFKKDQPNIKMAGFRKGKVTKEAYIKKNGVEPLLMDASDLAINASYKKALDDAKVEPVCEPSVSIEEVSPECLKIKYTFISKPEVTLGKYTKLGIKKDEVKVTKEEIDKEIKDLQDSMAEIVNKENGTVEKGNIAIIDFDGVVDGKPLEGGSSKDYHLEIGSNTFIPGFEEKVEGMKLNQTKKINLTFPDDYVENLRNKKVTFTVTVKGIQERVKPEINKDFFDDLAIEGVKDKETLNAHIKKELTEKKEDEAENKYVDAVLRKATENMKVELNPEIIHDEVHRMVHQYEDELKYQGASLDQYLHMTGTKMEDLEKMMEPQAIARIKTRYLLEEIVDKEKIKATKEEIKKEIKENAEKYGMKEEEFLDAIGGEDAIEYDVKMKKAVDIVKEA